MILAALGGHFHWSRAELEALTWPDAKFWHEAALEYLEQAKGKG